MFSPNDFIVFRLCACHLGWLSFLLHMQVLTLGVQALMCTRHQSTKTQPRLLWTMHPNLMRSGSQQPADPLRKVQKNYTAEATPAAAQRPWSNTFWHFHTLSAARSYLASSENYKIEWRDVPECLSLWQFFVVVVFSFQLEASPPFLARRTCVPGVTRESTLVGCSLSSTLVTHSLALSNRNLSEALLCPRSWESDVSGEGLASAMSALWEVQQDAGCRESCRGEEKNRMDKPILHCDFLFNSALIYVEAEWREWLHAVILS